jgi:hypothetical protein
MNETELIARLEKLERDNRRLKRVGTAALMMVAALGLMAATQSVPNVIRAHEFEVVDSAGKVGMRLRASSEGANMLIAPNLSAPSEGKTAAVSLGANGDRSWVTLGYAGWFTAPTKTQPFVAMEGSLSLSNSSAKGPTVVFSDSQGYVMSLGNTALVAPGTGATQQTSADSIVMFDKKRDVIWQAP